MKYIYIIIMMIKKKATVERTQNTLDYCVASLEPV